MRLVDCAHRPHRGMYAATLLEDGRIGCARAFQVPLIQAVARSAGMRMTIDESRHQNPPIGFHHLIGSNIKPRPHGGDFAPGNKHIPSRHDGKITQRLQPPRRPGFPAKVRTRALRISKPMAGESAVVDR